MGSLNIIYCQQSQLTFGYLSTGISKRNTRFTTNELGLPGEACQSMGLPCGPPNLCCKMNFRDINPTRKALGVQ